MKTDPMTPPFNLWNVPSRDWFDNARWLRQHSKETANRATWARVDRQKPSDFMGGR